MQTINPTMTADELVSAFAGIPTLQAWAQERVAEGASVSSIYITLKAAVALVSVERA